MFWRELVLKIVYIHGLVDQTLNNLYLHSIYGFVGFVASKKFNLIWGKFNDNLFRYLLRLSQFVTTIKKT